MNSLPVDLEDVSKYPNLFAELLSRGWTESNLEKLAGGNLLRALIGAEKVTNLLYSIIVFPVEFIVQLLNNLLVPKVRDDMANVKPYDDWIPQSDMPSEALPCSSNVIAQQNDALRSSPSSIIVLAIALLSQFVNLLS